MARSRSTTKKRKASAATPSAGEDPGAFIEKIREEKVAELEKKKPGGRRRKGPDDDLDVDHLTRLTSALISTNEEIWSRCKDSRLKADEPNCYKRAMFRYVQVETSAGKLQFNTHSIFEVSSTFATPTISQLPRRLTSVLVVSPRSDEPKLPDYDKLFKAILLYHDDVLIPLLKIFKDHLEEVQVRLGEIEEWLMAPKSCEAFLEETFEKNIPEPKINGCPSGCQTCHSNFDLCIKCGKAHNAHNATNPHRTYGSYSSYSSQSSGQEKHRCPGTNTVSASFFKSETICLKSFYNSKCSHEEKFDLTNDEARNRLKKFLDYVS